MTCPGSEDKKRELGLATLFNLGRLKGLTEEFMFSNYVNGLNFEGRSVDQKTYQERGTVLSQIYKHWLAKW